MPKLTIKSLEEGAIPGKKLGEYMDSYGGFDLYKVGYDRVFMPVWFCSACGTAATPNELSIDICSQCYPLEQTNESYTGKVMLA